MTTHTAQIGWGECEECEEGPCSLMATYDDPPIFLCKKCYDWLWNETARIDAEEEV